VVVQHSLGLFRMAAVTSATDKTKQTKQISNRIIKFDKYLRILDISIYLHN
jgi:hypothetical protein